MSRPMPAPVRCIPRPATVRKTSRSVRNTACEVVNPIDGKGVYLPNTEFFAGQYIWKANDTIIDLLRERGVLLASAKLTHSYPHCWRHKSPVAFRATPQWFISMEQANLRDDALKVDRERALDSRLGRGAHRRHDRRSSGLVHLAPAYLGRADCLVHPQADRRTASAIRSR